MAVQEKEFMNNAERYFQQEIYKYLKNDGFGHHHATYAKIFKAYPLTIVPLGQEPATAAISWDNPRIYINTGLLQGFGQSTRIRKQVLVIIRHELLHNMLMHQVRMVNKLSKQIPEANLTLSSSLHELMNILEDFEISNKKYSEEDKQLVRNTILNGKIISGLVTEDHRDAWKNKSVEQMWDAMDAELAKYDYSGETDWKNQTKYDSNREIQTNATAGNLEYSAQAITQYKRSSDWADFNSIDEVYNYIMKPALVKDPDEKMPAAWQTLFDVAKTIEKEAQQKNIKKEILKLIDEIKATGPTQKADIYNPITGKVLGQVYTPEEKTLMIELLHIICGNTKANKILAQWYDEIQRVAKEENLTEDELKDILAALD